MCLPQCLLFGLVNSLFQKKKRNMRCYSTSIQKNKVNYSKDFLTIAFRQHFLTRAYILSGLYTRLTLAFGHDDLVKSSCISFFQDFSGIRQALLYIIYLLSIEKEKKQ